MMDALQFGRWLGTQRRACGWSTQRALVLAARHDPIAGGDAPSEDFIARLEAGRLRHPFRGTVRHRVLVLASLLCLTRRDLDTYLAASGLLPLGAAELATVERMRECLRRPRKQAPTLLPPRPPRLIGRAAALDDLVRRLCAGPPGLYIIGGMVGVGKSALAAEALHMVAGSAGQRATPFRDGIISVKMTGYLGSRGLLALLQSLAQAFAAPESTVADRDVTPAAPEAGREADHEPEDGEVARVANRVRIALAEREVLLLLDDLDPRFPLRDALEVLLVQGRTSAAGNADGLPVAARRVVLMTSRYLPAPAVVTHQTHLEPLDPKAAMALLAALLGYPLAGAERTHAARICRAVGYLPLGIEAAASALLVDGIPLALLAERTTPLLLESQSELRAELGRALEAVGPEARTRFALLPLLGSGAFELAAAASLDSLDAPASRNRLHLAADTGDRGDWRLEVGDRAGDGSLRHLATTAGGLGQLVRHSLLDLTSSLSEPAAERMGTDGGIDRTLRQRYTLHPLLRAWAREHAQRVDPEVIAVASDNLQAYALTFLERHAGAADVIVRERAVLLAALTQARRTCQHAVVLRLTTGLLGVEGCLGGYRQAVHVLCWGLRASRYERDPYTAARMLNRLGRLLYYHGDAERARRAWTESLSIAESLRRPVTLWHTLGNLALIAGMSGEHEAAQGFATDYFAHASRENDGNLVALTLLRRGMCARLRGDAEAAYADLSDALGLLEGSSSPVSRRHTMVAEARLELARVQGLFPEMQRQATAAESCAQDTYGLADLLSEQASIACACGAEQEARALARRAATVARKSEAHMLHARSATVLRQLD